MWRVACQDTNCSIVDVPGNAIRAPAHRVRVEGFGDVGRRGNVVARPVAVYWFVFPMLRVDIPAFESLIEVKC